MRKLDNNTAVFVELLKAGLWEHEVQLSYFDDIDFTRVYDLACEQSVVGLVAAGIEHAKDVKVPKPIALEFASTTIQLEQNNKAMNSFIARLVNEMRQAGIYTLLLKGQGISQCYEKPLWRACGDIDFFLNRDDFEKATYFLKHRASEVSETDDYKYHLPMTIDNWVVELHGTMRGGLWKRLDGALDEIQKGIFYSGNVRSWMNEGCQIFLPRADEDIAFVFSHILQHFFRGGIGLRQVCDWCRLLWTYRDKFDMSLLGKRFQSMGVVTEWKAFASLAVEYLGMPKEAMPFYSSSTCWKRKAYRILKLILETGNFGQNRDLQYQQNHSFFVRKAISLWRLTWDSMRQLLIFPIDPIRVWLNMFDSRMRLLFQRNSGSTE